MTISSITNKMSGTTGNGAAQTIAFTFPVFASSEVKVVARETATGDETLLTETTHYTVSLTGTGSPNYSGGSITTTETCYDTYDGDYVFYVYRVTTQSQAMDLTENDALPAETVESRFDRLFCLIADLQEQIDRSIKIPITESNIVELDNSVDRASTTFGFDSNGDISLSTIFTAVW